MIEQIHLTDVATFQGRHNILDLKQVNYFFGGNGVGKSTLAKALREGELGSGSEVVWKNGRPMKVMVYDKHFVDSNFSDCDELSGIFTLGSDNIELQKKTKAAYEATKKTQQDIDAYADSLAQKETELASNEERLKDNSWEVKKRFEQFGVAFEGSSSTKDRFKTRVLFERQKNTSDSWTLAKLVDVAKVLFGQQPLQVEQNDEIDYSRFNLLETSSVLAKKVVGKEDIDIAAVILRLGCGDWVFRGRAYMTDSDGVCPFCQRSTDESLKAGLEQYFDASFMSQIEEIRTLELHYKEESSRLATELAKLVFNAPRFLNHDQLLKEKELFNATVKANLAILEQKRAEPSRMLKIEQGSSQLKTVNALIAAANVEAIANNEVLKDWTATRKQLTGRVWRYLLDNDLSSALASYDSEREKCEKAIKGIRDGSIATSFMS